MQPSSFRSLSTSGQQFNVVRNMQISETQVDLNKLTELISICGTMEGKALAGKVKEIFNLVNSKNFYCNEDVITEVGKFISSKPNVYCDEMSQLKAQHELCLKLSALDGLPHNQGWIQQVENIIIHSVDSVDLKILLKIFPQFISDNEKKSTETEKIILHKFHSNLKYYSNLLDKFKQLRCCINSSQTDNQRANIIQQPMKQVIQELEKLIHNNPELFNTGLGGEIFVLLEYDIMIPCEAELSESTKNKLLNIKDIIAHCNYLSSFHEPSDISDVSKYDRLAEVVTACLEPVTASPGKYTCSLMKNVINQFMAGFNQKGETPPDKIANLCSSMILHYDLDQQIRAYYKKVNQIIPVEILDIHNRFKDIFTGTSTTLNLNNSHIYDMVELLQNLKITPSVTELHLSNNGITDINGILENESLKQLTLLNLSNNYIEEIPSSLTNLTNLKTLDLSSNPINLGSMANLKGISSVTELHLSNSGIMEINGIVDCMLDSMLKNEALKQLTLLNLSNNEIRDIPSSLTNLTNLETLDLSGNPLNLESVAHIIETEGLQLKKLNLSNVNNVANQHQISAELITLILNSAANALNIITANRDPAAVIS